MNASDGLTTANSEIAKFDSLFSVRKSIRYHERRQAFFERFHRVTAAVTILLSGVILMEIAGINSPWHIKALSVIGAILGTADLVLGFAKSADLHRDLKRRFADLEIALMTGLSPSDAEIQRRKIENDEPPIFAALDILCREEMCAAEGCENEYKPLTGLPRITAQWCRWPNVAARMKKKS
jgi:hypothetical protein